MKLVEFPQFLASYLSAEIDLDVVRALRTFAVKDPESFRKMRSELRALLSATTDLSKVRDDFRTQGRFLLPEEPVEAHQMLREIYAHSEVIMNEPSSTKPYDVFVSYSNQDRAVASRLAKDLTELGYIVWLDAWEMLVGHNIVDEVYKGITGARFVVVLLSPDSCQSEWVKQEFTTALLSEIEARQVIVLPAKIETCEIPTPLKNKRYADFTLSWEEGFREIATAIDLHQTEIQLNRQATPITIPRSTPARFNELDQWRRILLPTLANAGFTEGDSFKDVLVGPIDGSVLDIDKARLKPIVDASRVWLNRWGGPPFPYDRFPSTEELRLQDGLRYVDKHRWPYRSKSFHFWQIDTQFHFLHRSHIDEDVCLNGSEEFYISNTLVRMWALIDIVRPLHFTRNLLNHEPGLRSMGLSFLWGGLEDRSLLELDPNRLGFLRDYRASVPEWHLEIEVTRQSNIVEEARKSALDLFWHFGWEPDGSALSTLDRDLESLANGIVPN